MDKGIPIVLVEYAVTQRSTPTSDALTKHLASRAYFLKYVTSQALAHGMNLPFTGTMVEPEITVVEFFAGTLMHYPISKRYRRCWKVRANRSLPQGIPADNSCIPKEIEELLQPENLRVASNVISVPATIHQVFQASRSGLLSFPFE